ncbi:GMC oxidoreductase-domain-containing protein [Halenospora varia]|nr:GMC oxidoreductase-domain-containing protein [Halenospora varia]
MRANPTTSLNPLIANLTLFQTAYTQYAINRTGPFTSPGGATYGFQQFSRDELLGLNATEHLGNRTEQAHIEYYYEAAYYPTFPYPGYPPKGNESYISLTAGLLAPVSKGNVTLQSNSVADALVINPNYFEAESDQRIAVYAFKKLRKLLISPAMFRWGIGPNNGEVVPGINVQSDEEILNYIRSTEIPVWHASGTCVMLPREKEVVVDPRLKVPGLKGLRVVDASIFPFVPDQHTQGSVYMVAEKATDMIKEDWGF